MTIYIQRLQIKVTIFNYINLNVYLLAALMLNFELLVIAPFHAFFKILYLIFHELNILEMSRSEDRASS